MCCDLRHPVAGCRRSIAGVRFEVHRRKEVKAVEQQIELDVLEISDLIAGAGENDDLAQVMAASCTTSSVSTSSSSSSS
ncbi:thiocillin/thiostrepton family thiazolyl peptide [Streptomyces marianii]|uniref:Thiocillin/thiostrepton family thiazolyl peptide n=1 Tax=Streptomyces marianii TaxID=1817406 RepID=A0A5R9E5G2_9ACTN|nr:thiocillin/thiostrepton family thiazolyl peptide [Streptomyces marianii]